jgi:hypothetical protein
MTVDGNDLNTARGIVQPAIEMTGLRPGHGLSSRRRHGEQILGLVLTTERAEPLRLHDDPASAELNLPPNASDSWGSPRRRWRSSCACRY